MASFAGVNLDGESAEMFTAEAATAGIFSSYHQYDSLCIHIAWIGVT